MRDRNGWSIGRQVRVLNGVNGVPGRNVATVISHTRIITDGRGVPVGAHGGVFADTGCYKPVNWREDVAVQYGDGTLGVQPKRNLGRVKP